MSLPSRNAGFTPWSLLFLAMGVALVASLVMQDLRLIFTGLRTTAKIEAIDEGGRGRYLRLAFKTEDKMRVKVTVSESLLSNYAAGGPVEIAYLRSDPGTAEILTFAQMGISVLSKLLLGGTALLLGVLGLMPDRDRTAT